MENKCNKTPNNLNNNSKYLDHVYCHTNENKNYIRANNNNSNVVGSGGVGGGTTAAGSDVLALLKENKQLKAMLILHLDLIQEQSDQLIAKDKKIASQSEELECVRTRNAFLESQIQELQQQLQRQLKRTGEYSALPPPPLAKIQCKGNESVAAITSSTSAADESRSDPQPQHTNIIGECNGKLISKIILQRVSLTAGQGEETHSPITTTDTEAEELDEEEGEEAELEPEEDAEEEEVEGEDDDGDDIQEEDNEEEVEEKGISDAIKTDEQEVNIEDVDDAGNSTEDSNEVLAVQSKRLRLRQTSKLSLKWIEGIKPDVNTTSTPPAAVPTKLTTGQICVTPPTPSRGKQMPLMLWHAPDLHTDESASCDSTVDTERRSASVTSCSPAKLCSTGEGIKSHVSTLNAQTPHQPQQRTKLRRCTYISTSQMYNTREWEDETFIRDYDNEFIKGEAKVLHADAPMLEVPKWTEHELTPSYCIEGTEDLSDDIFLKRHAKLEVDEKRRKKWDVQQIREQRRIEKLKRRHCKDELQPLQENPTLQSFYPQADAVQTIHFVQDLPVQAFGEMIPRLLGATQGEFVLPWLDVGTTGQTRSSVAILATSHMNTTPAQAQQQMLNSSFVFLKKRKRQQSSSAVNISTGTTTFSRQRSTTASKLVVASSTPSAQNLTPLTASISTTSISNS